MSTENGNIAFPIWSQRAHNWLYCVCDLLGRIWPQYLDWRLDVFAWLVLLRKWISTWTIHPPCLLSSLQILRLRKSRQGFWWNRSPGRGSSLDQVDWVFSPFNSDSSRLLIYIHVSWGIWFWCLFIFFFSHDNIQSVKWFCWNFIQKIYSSLVALVLLREYIYVFNILASI